MPRLTRLAVCGALAALLAGCPSGGQGPTQPDIERDAPADDPGLDDPGAGEPGSSGEEPSPGQSPVDEPASEEEGVAP